MMEELVWIGSAVVAALGTFWIHHRLHASPVMASSLVSLVFALAVWLWGDGIEWLGPVPYAAIGGSFIGMSSKKYVKGIESILLASLIFGVLFSRSSQFFEGYGGALGTSACISVLTAVSWRRLVKRSRQKVKRAWIRSGR